MHECQGKEPITEESISGYELSSAEHFIILERYVELLKNDIITAWNNSYMRKHVSRSHMEIIQKRIKRMTIIIDKICSLDKEDARIERLSALEILRNHLNIAQDV